MKAFKLFFAAVVLLLLLAIAAMGSLVAYLDQHKDLLERSASSMLGREVRIEDGIQLHWSMTPSITLAGLWVGNPDWARGEYFLRAEQAFLQLDIAALLHRRLQISQVTVQKADIDFQTTSDGKHNWHFDKLTSSASSSFELAIDEFEADASHLRYRSANDQDYQVAVHHLELTELDSEELKLDTEFSYQDRPFTLSASVVTGASDSVSPAAGRAFSGRLTSDNGRLTSDNARLDFSGHLKVPLALAEIKLEFHSDHLQLQKLWPTSSVDGSLRKITAQLKTSGATPQSLLNNLSGSLDIASSQLTLPDRKGGKISKLALTGTHLTIVPDQALRLQTALAYDTQTFQVELTGGIFAHLFATDTPWKNIKLKARGQFDKKPVALAGTFGPLSAVLSGRDLGFDLSAHHNDLKARVDGTLARFNELKDSRFTLAVSGPSLALLKPWLGVDLPESSAFSFTSQLEVREHRLDLKGIKTSIGKSDLKGEMSFPLRQQNKEFRVNLKSNLLELTPFLSTGQQRDTDFLSLMERELPPQALQDLDGVIHLEIGHLQSKEDIEFEDIKINAKLAHGRLKLTMTAEGERLNADVDLKPEDTQWRLVLKHKGKLDLSRLIKQNKAGNVQSEAPLALDVKLNGAGRSLAQVLGSANGSLLLELGAGRLNENISGYLPLGNVLYSVLNMIPSDNRSASYSNLECVVFQLDISNGIATSTNGLALRTEKINVLGGGSLKLRSGEIELQFKSAQRKGFGLSVLGIADKVLSMTGTLQHPRVKVNVGGLLLHGGAAWATGGISLLYDSLFKRLTAFSNPCEMVLKASKE